MKSSDRRAGCIVSYRLPDGDLRSAHRPGTVVQALRQIVAPLPEGTVVLSISTPASIERDLEHRPRTNRASADPDPYLVEKQFLGQIGRMDLLPPQATRLYHGREGWRERLRRKP